MRGFWLGTVGLVVLYTALRNSQRLQSSSNVLIGGLRRVLSSDVAGIPQRKGSGSPLGQAVGGAVSAGADAAGGIGQSAGATIGGVLGGISQTAGGNGG